MNNKIIIYITIILGISILGYGLIDYQAKIKTLEYQKQMAEDKILYQREEAIRDQRLKDAEALKKMNQYDACISEAYEMYMKDWNGKCKIEEKEDNCTLAQFQADIYNKRHEKEKETCLELYK